MPKSRPVDPKAAKLVARAYKASGLTKSDFAADVLVCGRRVLYKWLNGESMPPRVVLNKCRSVIERAAA